MTAITYKTCVSVGESTPAVMHNTITKALKRSEYAEARLDYINSPSITKDVKILLDSLPKEQLKRRIICTVRAKQDGGKFKHTEEQRCDLLRMVAAYKPYRLDVEIDTLQSNKKFANDLAVTNVSILASWHNFDHMPSTSVMRKKLQNMLKYTTHLKIACMAQNVSESTRMLDMYKWLADVNQKNTDTSEAIIKKDMNHNTRRKKNTLISFAMGDAGQMTRILCMHLGSPYTYVSLGKAIAPGQISLADVKNIEKTFS